MEILDCTLRDGGYYTNWDFDSDLVDTYIKSFNHLPVDYIEIGYRANSNDQYLGEFFYCPIYVLEKIKEKTDKKLVVILNEKNVKVEDIEKLLRPCRNLIDLVRIAVKPKFFERALRVGEEVKKLGFGVSFNVMYMSEWEDNEDLLAQFPKVDGIVDYLYLVDSYGGVYPNDVARCIKTVRNLVNVKLGFHGHNNLQMALANTLAAIDNDIDIIDSTITGMGRGAGNLETELLLSVLNTKYNIDLNFDYLSRVVEPFAKLKKAYGWGTNLPYMVSGANSLPQSKVMEWVSKRYYSLNSITRALSNRSKGISDNLNLPDFRLDKKFSKALIVGGGDNVNRHKEAIKHFLDNETDICIIHASSKNVKFFSNIEQLQIHALVGNEGHRLEDSFSFLDPTSRLAVLPPYPRTMGTYVPDILEGKAYQLDSFRNININTDSVTSLCIEIALQMSCDMIYFTGYDGYEGDISTTELELFNENNEIFSALGRKTINCLSLTPSRYDELKQKSVYSLLS